MTDCLEASSGGLICVVRAAKSCPILCDLLTAAWQLSLPFTVSRGYLKLLAHLPEIPFASLWFPSVASISFFPVNIS